MFSHGAKPFTRQSKTCSSARKYVEVNGGRKKLNIPGEEECLGGNGAATVAELTATAREKHNISGILLRAFAKLRKASSHLTVTPDCLSEWKT